MSSLNNGASVQSVAEQVAAAMAKGTKPDLAKAYVAFWGDVQNVVKNAQNPHLKNNYANLEATMAVVKPALAKNKLALLTMPGTAQHGVVAITTMLVHESGQCWTFTTEIPVGTKLDKKTGEPKPVDPQVMGSCISYGRRYIVQSISGMAAVDDDGEAASNQSNEAEPEAADNSADVAALTAALNAIKPEKGKKLEAITALEALKPRVQAAGDSDLGQLYMKIRSELKALSK